MKKIIAVIISALMLLSCLLVYADNEPYLNDPFYEQMWHYDAVKAHAFRDNGIDGRGVKVGIIDSGLTKELDKFPEFWDFDGVDIQTGINVCAKLDKNDELLYDTSDNGYHGTSVASIICAKANNEYGIAGLADGCTIIPYKIEDYRCSISANGGSFFKALDMAYQDDCDVLNISRGSDGKLSQSLIDLQNQAINKAIQNGMIVIASVGNSGEEDNHIEYPAACNNVIGVGAVRPNCEREEICIDAVTGLIKPESEATLDDEFGDKYIRNTIKNLNENDYVKLELSTANESVFVCAPGLNIPAVNCRSSAIRPFTSFLGTSSATPIVASAAIGVKQMRPYVDTDMFKEILKATAVDLEDAGYDINTGYGMVNFKRIYEYVSQMPLTAPERTPEVTVDYENGQLVGFPINREYTVNGETVTLNDDFSLSIKEEWYDTTIEIVKKASSDAYTDSEPQLLEIPAQPEPPTIEVAIDYANERLLGLENDKEYTVNGETVELETFVYPTTGTGFEIADDWFGDTIEIEIKGTDVSTNVEIPARKSAPIINVQNDNSVKFSSDILFKEENAATWNRTTAGNIITLKPGKTYVFKIPYTENSFASEIRQITVQFPETQYDIETSIEYDPDTGECTYSAVNNTIWTADVIGIIAVYAQNGGLKHLETVSVIPAEGINKKLNFALTDGDTVKWLVWDSLESMKPKEKVKLSEYNIKLKEATNT